MRRHIRSCAFPSQLAAHVCIYIYIYIFMLACLADSFEHAFNGGIGGISLRCSWCFFCVCVRIKPIKKTGWRKNATIHPPTHRQPTATNHHRYAFMLFYIGYRYIMTISRKTAEHQSVYKHAIFERRTTCSYILLSVQQSQRERESEYSYTVAVYFELTHPMLLMMMMACVLACRHELTRPPGPPPQPTDKVDAFVF